MSKSDLKRRTEEAAAGHEAAHALAYPEGEGAGTVTSPNSNDDRIAALEAKIAQLTISTLEAKIAVLEAQATARPVAVSPQDAKPPAPMGGNRIVGNFRPNTAAVSGSETQVVSTPEQAVITQRRANRAEAVPPVLQFGGRPDNGPITFASATGSLTDRGPAFQSKPTHLSGRSAD
jgi:hypothetical protein